MQFRLFTLYYLIHSSVVAAEPKKMTTLSSDVPQFEALRVAAEAFRRGNDQLHLKNLLGDLERCQGLSATHLTRGRKIMFDYSRQQVTGETMELLFDLAAALRFSERRAALYGGARINSTEDRAVLHHALRMPKGFQFTEHPRGADILKSVHDVRDRVEHFSRRVRSGEHTGVTGKPLKNVISIGIGGSQLGPEFVMEALRGDKHAADRATGRTLRFLGNVDPTDFHLSTHDLDPEETLVIVVSKSFATVETMLNARTARQWLLDNLEGSSHDIIRMHMVAVSCDVARSVDFGIDKTNVFEFWDWVGGRFSVCSAVGMLPLSLQYSYEVMTEFLAGAHNMDIHFFKAKPRDNIPLMLGLLGVWNSTFMGYESRALLPYAQAMKRFPAHIQQVDMESNGKGVAADGSLLPYATGEINFGEPGTCGQHSFYQLLHQGRVVPADFIGFMEPQYQIKMQGELVSNHDELMANFFAQPDALANGKDAKDLCSENVPPAVAEHLACPGNRPSSIILMTKLDAFAIGQLLAMYEHRTAVQGIIWGINSFDQHGVELGKKLAGEVRNFLGSYRNSSSSVPAQGFNPSTTRLIEAYLDHGNNN